MAATKIAENLWKISNQHGHRGVELEFRLGHRLPGGTFSSNVRREAFAKVTETLKASKTWTDVYEIHTIDMIHGGPAGGKHITTTLHTKNGQDLPVPPPAWQTKSKLPPVDFEFGGDCPFVGRASVAVEHFAPAPHDSPPTTARRIKHRTRYVWKCWAFDLTRVQSTLPGDLDNDEASYEIEIELVDTGMMFERTMDSLAEWGLALIGDVVKMV